MSNSDLSAQAEGIAIIGLAGRFPKARNIAGFWENLRDGVEAISFFTEQELQDSGLDRSVMTLPNYVPARGALEDVEMFDAAFFGFTPKEARVTDPQHRFFLECAWEALENAGYDSERYTGRIGVYAGVTMSSYLVHMYLNIDQSEAVSSYRTMIGNDKDYLSTWASYKLNLTGPSMSIQSACSTSLVAAHVACQSLLNGECEIALAGGVSIITPQKQGYLYEEGSILSPDGHCRAFDAKAQGTVAGSGVGIVVLKRLCDALDDGDYIHSVIKGSAVNNDGAVKVGYTAPSVKGQSEVIAEALAVAGVGPETISYVETHGTGTELGDPIEITALTRAFRAATDRKGYCAVGSVKTNVGHLDAAAGVTGLIKTVLALEHQKIPPSLHFEEPNPRIDLVNSPFYVNRELIEWTSNGTPRRAGVSSFGIGGTNAHAIVEEGPEVEPSSPSRIRQLLLLSAKTKGALERATINLVEYLNEHREVCLADVAYTLQVGRRTFAHRRALVCKGSDDAVEAFQRVDKKRIKTRVHKASEPSLVFMFTGQGAQYVNMGLELYETEAAFREQIDLCGELLTPHLGLDLKSVLYPQAPAARSQAARLDQTFLTQPALFVVEYALAQLWIKWGMRPAAMIGHSIGEYVAACLAGVLSLADALTLVAVRGRLMQQLPGGSMLAVALPAEVVGQEIIDTDLSLAVINGPAQCVVAGPDQAVAEYEQRLAQNGSSARRLKTSHAFHSTMMGPIVERFIGVLKDVKLNPPRIPFISNVTGTWITATQATDPQYWGSHLLRTVNFAAGVTELLKEEQLVLLEVGPGRTLSTLVKHQLNKSADQQVFSSLPTLSEHQSDLAVILETLGQLWLAGVKIEWPALYAAESRHRLPLPTYPFERKRYWIKQRLSADPAARSELALGHSGSETAVEEIMSQQLQIMNQQLDVLRAG